MQAAKSGPEKVPARTGLGMARSAALLPSPSLFGQRRRSNRKRLPTPFFCLFSVFELKLAKEEKKDLAAFLRAL